MTNTLKFHLTCQVYTPLLKGIFCLVFQTTACLVLIWLFWLSQSPLLDRLPLPHLSLYTGRTQDYSTFLFCSLNSLLGDLTVQFSSVTQSCPTLCDPMNHSTPGLRVHHQLPEFTQTCVHRVSDAIQPSHPLSPPSPPAPNPSQHQSLFQWVNSSHEVAKVLEFQL